MELFINGMPESFAGSMQNMVYFDQIIFSINVVFTFVLVDC